MDLRQYRKFRIVRDTYSGYEAQIWRPWFPFWIQMSTRTRGANTHSTIEAAEIFINKRKNYVVKRIN